jgi:hypothetical protein
MGAGMGVGVGEGEEGGMVESAGSEGLLRLSSAFERCASRS